VALAPDIIAAVSRRLADHAGLELPAWVVEARATARIAACGIEPAAYVELIKSIRGAGELDELIEAVRVGESRLFRHRSQIAALTESVVPAWRAAGRRFIRVWSAGCAAGEEPYTLAAVLARALPGVELEIEATDVSADALEIAARASYPASAWDDIPEVWRDDFAVDDDRVCVRPEIRELVRFSRANLADARGPLAPRNCDLVWCRNVLIYFTPVARRRVIERLVAATKPGGFLFVGYSESLRDIAELDAVRAGDAVYYTRRDRPIAVPRALTPAGGVAIPRTRTPHGVLVVHGVNRTPPVGNPVVSDEDVLVLRGHPSIDVVTAELMSRLAIAGLRRLVVDLDSVDMLGEELVPVLRRARSAARAAHVELELRATKPGARRWLSRHELDEPDRTGEPARSRPRTVDDVGSKPGDGEP
jgi:chemotaxis protein methyltransferase CheR